VTWATSVLVLVFLGLCSRLMLDVRDRQTETSDVRHASSLRGGGHKKKKKKKKSTRRPQTSVAEATLVQFSILLRAVTGHLPPPVRVK